MTRIDIIFTTGERISVSRKELFGLVLEPIVVLFFLLFGVMSGFVLPLSIVTHFSTPQYVALLLVKSFGALLILHVVFFVLHSLTSYAHNLPLPSSIALLLTAFLLEFVWVNAMRLFFSAKVGSDITYWGIGLLELIVIFLVAEIFYSLFILKMTSFWANAKLREKELVPTLPVSEIKTQIRPATPPPATDKQTNSVIIGKDFIVLADLLYVKAEQHYVRIITSRKSSLVRCRFTAALDVLPPTAGIRVHRSYWIAFLAIKDLTLFPDGRGEIVLNNDETIPVSRAFRKPLLDALSAKS